MARQFTPRGNPNNLLSYGAKVGNQVIAKASRSGNIDLYEQKSAIIREQGRDVYDKVVKLRYDWLFDDLQRFTSISPESIETKEDLKAFVEDTVGKSKGFESMKEKAPRSYENSVNRMVSGLWRKGMVEEVARTNVVEEVSEDRASLLAERVKKDRSRRRALSDARLGNLYLVRREKLVSKRVDKRGRVFFMEVLTGRRTRNPEKLLKELGF